MVEKKSEHYSPEVFTYQFETDAPWAVRTIFEYRHKLMEKFVGLFLDGQVESTRIIHKVDIRGNRATPVVFEFTLREISEEAYASTSVVTTNDFDYTVSRLFKALDAEKALQEAQDQLTNNAFD